MSRVRLKTLHLEDEERSQRNHNSKPKRREVLLYFKDKSIKRLEYSNDRYDSGVRVKSGYRLYMPIYQKVMSVLFSIVFCVQLLNVIDKSN